MTLRRSASFALLLAAILPVAAAAEASSHVFSKRFGNSSD